MKESDIAKAFMQKTQEKDIEVKLEQAQNNKKEEQKQDYKKRSYTLPNQQERADLIVKLVKDEREGSLASSTDALNRSLDKYNYYEEFISSQHHPIHLKMIKVGRLTEYLILLIATIASILTLYTSFDNLLQNIDSLTLHSNILQPYGNTICISDTVYFLQKYGTTTQKDQLIPIKFVRERFQFEQFSEMIKEEWRNSYLTSYFTDNSLDLYNSYKLTGFEYIENQNLLSATSRLLFALNENQQYTAEEAANQFYLPERQFLAVNYSQFLKFFKDLVKETLDDSITYNSGLVTNIIVQTVVLNIITLFIFCISGWNYYHFSKNIMSILKMCETASTISVEHEMFRFQKMQEELSENENILFNYTFSIQQKEIELTRIADKSNQFEKKSIAQGGLQQSGGTKRKKLLVNVQYERIKYSGFALFILFVYLLFVVFTITTYVINTNFLNQFEPAIKYYKSVSDSNFELSQLPSLKALINEYNQLSTETNKQNSIQYINTKVDDLQYLFDQGLDNVLQYRQEILDFNKLDFFNSDFKSQMDGLINGNICDTADDKLDNTWSPTRCQSILQGVLTQGLSNSISKWYDTFHSFKQLNYKDTLAADQLLSTYVDQSYLSITLSNYTTSMRNTIKNSLSSSTQNQKDVNLIISLVFISIVSIIYFYEIFKGMKNITHRFQMAKKIIFLVPLQTVMIEETFIKILKAQSNRLEIVK